MWDIFIELLCSRTLLHDMIYESISVWRGNGKQRRSRLVKINKMFTNCDVNPFKISQLCWLIIKTSSSRRLRTFLLELKLREIIWTPVTTCTRRSIVRVRCDESLAIKILWNSEESFVVVPEEETLLIYALKNSCLEQKLFIVFIFFICRKPK